jgi:hypothetical protein
VTPNLARLHCSASFRWLSRKYSSYIASLLKASTVTDIQPMMVYDIFFSSPIHEWAPQLTKIQRPPSPLLLPCQLHMYLVSTVTGLASHAHRLQMSLVLLNLLFFTKPCPVDVDATYSGYGRKWGTTTGQVVVECDTVSRRGLVAIVHMFLL